MQKLKNKYNSQKSTAKQRGIEFKLTFNEISDDLNKTPQAVKMKLYRTMPLKEFKKYEAK